jgi:hypothetical protein
MKVVNKTMVDKVVTESKIEEQLMNKVKNYQQK